MATLPLRNFGETGLKVSALGFGAGHIGEGEQDEKQIGALLNGAIDLGINLFDTARSYGLSEERIGKLLGKRRNEILLSTKIGYGIEGFSDWTAGCISAGVEEALKRLKTDRIDIVHFHSCPVETLKQDDVIESLLRAVEQGKILVPAYSGDNEALEFAISRNKFRSIQTSLNISDQSAMDSAVHAAKARGMGVIAKRPAANAPWRFASRPNGHYAEEYWSRWKTMNVDPAGLDWQEIAIRFAVHHTGADTAIIGTNSIAHLKEDVEHAANGPLPEKLFHALRAAFAQHRAEWDQRT
jgi:aryl-alcohol dehydrogenase-like predicted oxidoreductase